MTRGARTVPPDGGDATRSLTETAYRTIREQLLSGLHAPQSKLRIDELRRRLGIGASPIREALSRMVSEGLVTVEEQKGFRAAPMSIPEFGEITELRILIESEGLRKAIQNGREQWESGIVASYHLLAHAERQLRESGKTDEWEIRNREFHDALVQACDSTWLMRIREILYVHSQRYRYRSLVASPVRRNKVNEHRLLRDAVLARDAEKACDLILKHFLLTYDNYVKAERALS
jgi:GntR family carbon starvation induced transcriptional regulator